MNALFLTSCPPDPYPSPFPCVPLSPSSSVWLTILCLATLVTLINWKQPQCSGYSTDESSTSLLMTVCFWFVVDWGQKPATPGEAGAGRAEAAADHSQGWDSAWSGGWASPEGSCPHKGIGTFPLPCASTSYTFELVFQLSKNEMKKNRINTKTIMH